MSAIKAYASDSVVTGTGRLHSRYDFAVLSGGDRPNRELNQSKLRIRGIREKLSMLTW
jgi:hypothetical protein